MAAPLYRTYPMTPLGYGPQFSEMERPVQYGSRLVNRFVNPGGGLEARRGLVQVGSTISNVSAPDLKSLHQMVLTRGTAVTMVAGSAAGQGRIWRLDTSAETTWTQIRSGANASAKFRSAQFDDKAIFVNGANRNVFTTDASGFRELVALLEQGEAESTADATAHDKLKDSTNFSNFLTETDIAVNDLLFDATTSAYAVITDVKTSHLAHTPLTAASQGLSSGKAAKAGGDDYEIHDLVESNVVRLATQDEDNIAVAGNGASTTIFRVSAPAGTSGFQNFSRTELTSGDFVRNTTRNRVARITNVSSTEITHTVMTGQVAGDSLVFLKSAMPIAEDVHVNYGRAWYKDARDRRKARISGPNDPQDLTNDAGTLDAVTFRVGAQQPEGDEIVKIVTFQQYTVIGGKRHLWLFTGIDPIADVSTKSSDLRPASLFPQGLVSPDSLITIGNDVVFLTPDGLQSASLAGSDTLPTRENMSDALRDELQLEMSGASANRIVVRNYPKRAWVIAKVSSRWYCFNYSPNLASLSRQEGDLTQPGQKGSWHVFEGRLARMNDMFVNLDGDLLVCDSSGRVFEFDDEGVYTDGGTDVTADVQTAWLGMDEQARGLGRPSRKQKAGTALIVNVQGSANETYTISVTAPYSGQGSETVTHVVSAQAQPIDVSRIPINWRGEEARFGFRNVITGHSVLGSFTVVHSIQGVR